LSEQAIDMGCPTSASLGFILMDSVYCLTLDGLGVGSRIVLVSMVMSPGTIPLTSCFILTIREKPFYQMSFCLKLGPTFGVLLLPEQVVARHPRRSRPAIWSVRRSRCAGGSTRGACAGASVLPVPQLAIGAPSEA